MGLDGKIVTYGEVIATGVSEEAYMRRYSGQHCEWLALSDTASGFALDVALLWRDPLPGPAETVRLVDAMLG